MTFPRDAQWLHNLAVMRIRVILDHRCGGSVGLSDSQITDFPFIQTEVWIHL